MSQIHLKGRAMEKDFSDKGLVIVYTGNGKGKTTAALGLCVRAVGYDEKVCIIQFIKGINRRDGVFF